MGIKLSNDIINKIPVLYNQYKNKTKVAKELGISVASVNKYLTVIDAATLNSTVRRSKTKITPEIIQQINDEYAICKNMSAVAKKLGISATTVKKYLNKENLELIKKQNDDRDALWYYIYRLFGQVSEDKPVSDWNITQMERFKSQGMPYRGQLLTLKYFYEVKKNSIKKSNGSIGM